MRLRQDPAWPEVPPAIGDLRLRALELAAVTQVSAIARGDVEAAFRAATGVGFPEPGEAAVKGPVRALWFGRETALVIGIRIDVAGALCLDQSDGWAALELAGAAREVLARLCPLDLRDPGFPVNTTARTLLHRTRVSLTRTSEDAWMLLVPRSTAASCLAEIVAAAEGVAAR